MKILLVYLEEDEKLKRCLDSLKKYSPELEIIKVKADRKKTKTAEEVYDEYLPKIDDDVMIWHPDMEALPNWYEDLKKYYNLFDVIGVKLIYPNKLINHYGGVIRADGIGIHPHQNCLDIGLDTPQSCAYVTGPGTVIKKYVYQKIGKYDHRFTYFIDVDFCFRARQAGFTIGVVPVKLIHHEGLDNLKKRPNWQTQLLLKESHELFVSKWLNELAKYK